MATLLLGIHVPGTPAGASDTWTPYEWQLFSRSFEQEPLAIRLIRLEERIFGASRPNDALPAREARLMSALSHFSADSSISQNAVSHRKPAQIRRDATDYPRLSALERYVLGSDFRREDIHNRLSRLEQRTFGQTFSDNDLADRLDRLLAHYPFLPITDNAGKPSVTSSATHPYTQAPKNRAPMVQIGAGFSQNNTWHFSQELLDMLPPDVRAQMNAPTQTTPRPQQQYSGTESTRPAADPFGNPPLVIGVPLAP